MTGADDDILEYLHQKEVALNKRGLEINLALDSRNISYSTIKRRLPKLADAGLIKVVDESGPWYQITEKGERYLDGEEDLRDLSDSSE